ncbi:LOW QUALITY PROTEIN: hypothetical protein N5P37_002404 [Trichoderma harzianum]|nr:LOW QUALITY PROTEIN: hypothetical protein N5P37_002404 [Trichoderma harzianum]
MNHGRSPVFFFSPPARWSKEARRKGNDDERRLLSPEQLPPYTCMPLNHPPAVIGLPSRKSLFRCCRARQVSRIMQVILHGPILSAQTVCSSAIQQTTLLRHRVVAALVNRGFRGAPNPNGPIPMPNLTYASAFWEPTTYQSAALAYLSQVITLYHHFYDMASGIVQAPNRAERGLDKVKEKKKKRHTPCPPCHAQILSHSSHAVATIFPWAQDRAESEPLETL